ncbi:uracil-DNA glycosylase family protein [Shewanella avicenniae]|uniref:Uracil-DNA glycosylase family protein n=1 Tax=Shewanella avicenniae TaxID=2814294 RepID=A0ABX7QV26_9GAMM|nr:uracil-DNA glycosylase family protein [Shewanella avicenniae]QSX34882.1 uracil-DNA glycosylase family protein [Shewanella avicenniae]
MANACLAITSEIANCHLCEPHLPLGAKPILQANSEARILIAGQAPGAVTHQRGRPFDDASGDRLRRWLNVDHNTFYNPSLFAIIPMGVCYPGKANGGDAAPRPECAATWRKPLLDSLANIQLCLLLGRYAIEWHLAGHPLAKAPIATLTAQWPTLWPKMMVLPHPSPRNNRWLAQHPQFEAEQLPRLQQRIAEILQAS